MNNVRAMCSETQFVGVLRHRNALNITDKLSNQTRFVISKKADSGLTEY